MVSIFMKYKYWCPVKFLRSNGLNQRSLTNGRQRPISIQPRALPWVGWLDGSRPEPKVADQREAKGKSHKFNALPMLLPLQGAILVWLTTQGVTLGYWIKGLSDHIFTRSLPDANILVYTFNIIALVNQNDTTNSRSDAWGASYGSPPVSSLHTDSFYLVQKSSASLE